MYTIYWDSGEEDKFDFLYDVQEACIHNLPMLAEDIVDDNDKHYGCAWSVIIEPVEEDDKTKEILARGWF